MASPVLHFGHLKPAFSINLSVNRQSGKREQDMNLPNLPILITNSPFLHSGHFFPNFSVSILTLLLFLPTWSNFFSKGIQKSFISFTHFCSPLAILSKSSSIWAVKAY